jgi:hypothetical protein
LPSVYLPIVAAEQKVTKKKTRQQNHDHSTFFSSCYTWYAHAGSIAEATVVLLLNQGTFRQRGVSVGGVLFGYFLDKQKVTKKTAACSFSYLIKQKSLS